MIKSLRADIIRYSIIAILVYIISISMLLELFFISIPSTILCLIVGVYYEIQDRRHPYSENPKEIIDLKNKVENITIREFIKDSFFNNGRNLTKITHDLENKFNIELLIRKGFDSGNYKSKELIEKLCQILGFETRKECIDAYHELKKSKKEK